MNTKVFLSNLEKKLKGDVCFLPTGFNCIDRYVDGFYPGTIWTIGAWPGVGKTTLSLNLVAKQPNKNILMFDTETSEQVLMEKFYSLLSETSYKDVRQGKLNGMLHSTSRSEKTSTSIFHPYSGVDVVDKPCPTVDDVKHYILSLSPSIVIIDYFQNLGIKLQNGRYDGYTQAARDIERMAREFSTCFILLSQMRKPSEYTQPRPVIFDFKETGKLAEMSHVVIILENKGDKLVGHIEKNRGGARGDFELKCMWNCNKLTE